MRIGIDIGGTKIELVALNSSGEVIYTQRGATPKTNQELLKILEELINTSKKETGEELISIGVGIPGILDPKTRVSLVSRPCLEGTNVADDLNKIFNVPTRVANDANCFIYSEFTDGAAQGYNTAVGLIVGTGFGQGIVINGQIYEGSNGFAGELGHIGLPGQSAEEYNNAQECNVCGLKGCMDTWLTGGGLALLYKIRSGKEANGEEIVALADKGDKHAIGAIDDLATNIAKGIIAVVALIDPEVFVLGGGMSNIDKIYELIPGKFKELSIYGDYVPVVRKAMHGDSSGVRGAAWLPQMG